MITFSVVVPVYNAVDVLERCIQSVLRQTEQDFELLLADDGSTDGSGQLCDQWATRDARIRVIHQANKGLSATRNILIAHAKGTYIAPIDADDWVEPTYLHTLYSLCSRWNVPMAGCNHWLDGTTQAKVRYDQSMPDTLMTAQQACHGVLYHQPPDVSTWAVSYTHLTLPTIA